jgi:hypothetical protein
VTPRAFLLPVVALATAVVLAIPGVSPVQASPGITVKPDPITALHVPWAIGGPRIEPDGTLVQRAPEWPHQRVEAVRLWDTRTAWLNLNPAPGIFDFTNLDAHLQQAESHGVQHTTLVLWGTPRWAARDTAGTDAFWLGPGSASPPRDLQDWCTFVRTVAERYHGRIHAYEIGNEPTEPMFWRGSQNELNDMIAVAAEEIRRVDAKATVVAPIEAILDVTSPPHPRSRRAFPHVNAWAFHWYPELGARPAVLRTHVRSLRTQLAVAGAASTALWLTEVNLRPGDASPSQQLRDVARVRDIAREVNLDYIAWYAWSDAAPPEFINLQQPGLLEETLRNRKAPR